MKNIKKTWQYSKEFKNGFLDIFIKCELFNPFAKRNIDEMIPSFELIPRIGIKIRNFEKIRVGTEGFSLIVGWLNFYIELYTISSRKVVYLDDDLE